MITVSVTVNGWKKNNLYRPTKYCNEFTCHGIIAKGDNIIHHHSKKEFADQTES